MLSFGNSFLLKYSPKLSLLTAQTVLVTSVVILALAPSDNSPSRAGCELISPVLSEKLSFITIYLEESKELKRRDFIWSLSSDIFFFNDSLAELISLLVTIFTFLSVPPLVSEVILTPILDRPDIVIVPDAPL